MCDNLQSMRHTQSFQIKYTNNRWDNKHAPTRLYLEISLLSARMRIMATMKARNSTIRMLFTMLNQCTYSSSRERYSTKYANYKHIQ